MARLINICKHNNTFFLFFFLLFLEEIKELKTKVPLESKGAKCFGACLYRNFGVVSIKKILKTLKTSIYFFAKSEIAIFEIIYIFSNFYLFKLVKRINLQTV